MIKSLLSFFFGGDSDTGSFYQLYQKMVKWNKLHVYPNDFDLPKKLTLPYEFWEKVKGLHKNTLKDGLERSVSVYWADGDLILSTITTGTTSFVRSNSNMKIAYTPTHNPEYFSKSVYVDGSKYSTKTVYYKKVPKEIELQYLFNMHTHPAHRVEERTYYSFFSAQDIKSMIASGAIVTGLITDKFYLLIRTNEVSSYTENLTDSDITADSITNKYKYVLYSGPFNKTLNRFAS